MKNANFVRPVCAQKYDLKVQRVYLIANLPRNVAFRCSGFVLVIAHFSVTLPLPTYLPTYLQYRDFSVRSCFDLYEEDKPFLLSLEPIFGHFLPFWFEKSFAICRSLSLSLLSLSLSFTLSLFHSLSLSLSLLSLSLSLSLSSVWKCLVIVWIYEQKLCCKMSNYKIVKVPKRSPQLLLWVCFALAN